MDSTDVRIFCEMAFLEQSYDEFRERRPSAAKMGKKLGLDEKTVRIRVNKMEESGFVKYYQAAPSLALFGMHHVGIFRFEALNLSTKYALMSRLDEVPRLVESSDYLGPFITGSIAGATPEEARKEAEGLAAHYELSIELLGDREVVAPASRLDRLDWQIIKELRYDARVGDSDLAKTLSVTERMVGYRVSKLLGSGAIKIRAVIDPQRQAGLVFYELELHCEARRQDAVSRWLKEGWGDRLWMLSSPVPGVLLASLFCFTLAEPEESATRALKEEGVKRCILFILKEVIEPKRPNWIDSLIDLRLAS
ncbi:MAG TPA: AsnC family transcriptional regulator [Nitrososphaerales archaeon]|nr:AsnC family transcriptional regulator [Nitrososphaerales archaeon]HUK74910.1 AsnC family transcriptional regulator [Nitrososphaerales archaeon]